MVCIPHLDIPYIHLPLPLHCGKTLTGQSLPIATPLFHAFRVRHAGHAEEMQMVGHAQKLTHSPLRGVLPRQSNGLHSGGVVKQRAAIHDAHRAEQDDGSIEAFNRRMVCRIAPLGQCVYVSIAIHHSVPRRSSRPPSNAWTCRGPLEGDGPPSPFPGGRADRPPKIAWALIEEVPLLLGRLDVFPRFKIVFDEQQEIVTFQPS